MTKIGTNLSYATGAPVVSTPLSQQKVPGGINYVRSLRRNEHANLTRGDKVVFVNTNGDLIQSSDKTAVDLSLALSKAVSTKPELVVNGKVVVPDNIEPQAIAYLVSKISAVPPAHGVKQLFSIQVKD
jgi:hypothetical protein